MPICLPPKKLQQSVCVRYLKHCLLQRDTCVEAQLDFMQVLYLIADSPLVWEDDAFMQIIEMILLYLALMTHVCVPSSSSSLLPIFALLNQYYAPDSDGIV